MIVDALLVVYEPERAFQEITISMTSSADTKVAEGADMMGWMEALEITRFGGGADRASLANSAFQGAYTSADRDIYPSAAPLLTVDDSVEAGRGAPGLQKMAGFARARPEMNRGDPKFYTAKRTLILRFKLYLRTFVSFCSSTAISGKKI